MMCLRRAMFVGVLALGTAVFFVSPRGVHAQTPLPVPPAPPVPAPGPAPSPAPVPTPVPPTPNDLPVVGLPSMTVDAFEAVLRAHNSPMTDEAQAIYAAAAAANIDPSFLLAIARKEAVYATAPDWAGRKVDGSTTHNWGNVRCAGYTRCYNGWREYASWTEATQDWVRILQENYIAEGLTTVATIIPKYAPAIENDTAGYIQQVLQWMQEWRTGQTQPPPPPDQGLFSIDAWVVAPVNATNVDAWRQLSLTLWQQNLGALRVTETLATTSDTLTPALGPILDELGSALSEFGNAMIVLGIVIAGVGILLTPLLVRQTLVALHAVPVLLVVIFGVVPLAGTTFVATERFRRSLGDTLYEGLFAATDDALQPTQPPSTGGGLGDIPPLFEGRTEQHAVDVAAAYLMVDPTDLAREDVLPQRFADTFFPYSAAEIRDLPVLERQQTIDLATRGFNRMLSGLALTMLGQIEEGINTAFLFSLLILGVALLFTIVLAVFQPVLRLVDTLSTYVLQLFIWAAVIGVLQGVGMAFLFWVANTGTPGQIFGVGLILSGFDALLLLGTLVVVGLACWRSVQSIGNFQPIAGTATLVDTVRARLPQRSSAPRPAPLPVPGLSGLQRVMSGYTNARALGASRAAALAYVAAPAARVQRAGAVALALGKLPADVERTLLVGSSPRLQHADPLRQMVALRNAVQPHAPTAPQVRMPQPPPSRPRPPAPSPAQRPHRQRAQRVRAVRNHARQRRHQHQRGKP